MSYCSTLISKITHELHGAATVSDITLEAHAWNSHYCNALHHVIFMHSGVCEPVQSGAWWLCPQYYHASNLRLLTSIRLVCYMYGRHAEFLRKEYRGILAGNFPFLSKDVL